MAAAFFPDQAEEICALLTEGQSLAAICRIDGMPSMRTVMRWLAENEGFRQNHARAREASADADADAVGDIAARVLKGEYEPQAARVAIDALKWAAGVRQPKKYGPKMAIGGADDLPPIKTINAEALSDTALAEILAAINAEPDAS